MTAGMLEVVTSCYNYRGLTRSFQLGRSPIKIDLPVAELDSRPKLPTKTTSKVSCKPFPNILFETALKYQSQIDVDRQLDYK